jgi:hypothetical protein
MLDNRQCRIVIPEKKEIREVKPTITLAFCLEACNELEEREGKSKKKTVISLTDGDGWILECRKRKQLEFMMQNCVEVATIHTRSFSRNLVGFFMSLHLDIVEGGTIKMLRKEIDWSTAN